jgi:hypothetical protein
VQRRRRRACTSGGETDVAAEVLADVCAELGVRFEATSEEEAFLWEDDYLEVVAEAEVDAMEPLEAVAGRASAQALAEAALPAAPGCSATGRPP